MKDFYIEQAAEYENKVVVSSFLVASKQIKTKRSGELYLALVLADRTGQMVANMWDNWAEAAEACDQDDVIKVKGLINTYNRRQQITLHKLRRLEEQEIDYADYLPKGEKDLDELWRGLEGYVAGIQNPHLRGLLEAFLNDTEIAQGLRQAPAAKTLHHAYIGGLLEHVVSLLALCDLAVRNYPQVDRDLLLTGAVLHDIGKIHELAYSRSFAYTTRGQLLGHMIIELEMVQRKAAEVPDFPAELLTLLEHMLISHHGKYEFGSPKLPMFPEALMLHYLDDLDSKMESMRAQLEKMAGQNGEWAGYNSSLGRPILDARKFLGSKRAAEPEEEAAQVQAAKAGEEP